MAHTFGSKNEEVSQTDSVVQSYRKSSFCGGGSCVEFTELANGEVAVRDGKNPHKEPLVFDHEEWSAFIKGVKNGEFDN